MDEAYKLRILQPHYEAQKRMASVKVALLREGTQHIQGVSERRIYFSPSGLSLM